MEIYMTFKEKLVKLRKLKGLTQDEFASAVGVSRQAVYKWESGQSYPEVQKLIEMKLLFDISIDNLLDESYEVVVPEKKRKRRLSEEQKRKIEEMVRAEEDAKLREMGIEIPEEAPTAPVYATAKVEAAPAVEPVPVTVTAAAPVAETKKEEAPAAAPAVEEAPEKSEEPKKKGLFGRLFGK